MTTGLRWGIIGASDIAATRVIPAIRRGGDTVRFVQSTTSAWASAFATSNGIDRWLIDATPELKEVDAVYVSSANSSHAPQTIAALSAGKHVLCEKPLAMTIEDARAMTQLAEQRGLVLATNHHLPGAGTHRAIQRLVSSGALGRPLSVSVNHAVLLPERLRSWRLDDPTGGGVILDITVHDISAVQAMLGQTPMEATAVAVQQGDWGETKPSEVPDAVMAVLRFGDVLVQLYDAFTVAHFPTSVTVVGTEASVKGIDIMTQDPIGTLWRTVGSVTDEIAVPDRGDLYDIALDAFRGAIRGECEPAVSGTQGMAAMAGALAVRDSAATGRAVQIQPTGLGS